MKAVCIDTMGDDLKIVNAARSSFGKKSSWLGEYDEDGNAIRLWLAEKDAKLIRFLARGLRADEMKALINAVAHAEDNQTVRKFLNYFRSRALHWVPFGHCYMTFEITMPIFVARQLIRHTVGVVISEMSRRYVDEDPEYWEPATEGGWRLRPAADIKQGSSGECLTGLDADLASLRLHEHHEACTTLYRKMVDEWKVAPEIARVVLPLSSYTDWTWTASLVTVARVCHQRLDPHAQKEIQVLVEDIRRAAEERFPVAFKALMDFGTEDSGE